jgi:SAM-dependent methyltransferase
MTTQRLHATGSKAIDWPAIVQPTEPHDALSFGELSARYNYRRTSDRRGVLVRLLIQESLSRSRPVRALDIGCGTGISEEPGTNAEYLRAVRQYVDELWGVKPDRSVTPTHGLLDQFQHATLEGATLPENYFDIAYAYFVTEHVDDPAGFMRAIARCLKPGGAFIFITPNGRHYFTRIAKLLRATRLDEWVLRLMRGKSVEEYHYPVRYRMNTRRQIAAAARKAGLCDPEVAFVERAGPRTYFRGPTVVLYHLLETRRRLSPRPENLLELICRVEKPAA